MTVHTAKFDIKTDDGNCDCFAARPDEGGPFPAVLLLMDAYGPREYLYSMAEKIAAQGFYVLLPNLFYRLRRAPLSDVKFPLTAESYAKLREEIFKLYPQYSVEQALGDVRCFLAFFAQNEKVRVGQVGIAGYCLGGHLALRAAAQFPDRIAVAASFHGGRLANDAPNSPHRFAAQIKARLYLAHAENDESMPAEAIALLDRSLKAAGVGFESEIYEGAKHGFTMADLPAGNAAAIERHWQKLLPLLAEGLKK